MAARRTADESEGDVEEDGFSDLDPRVKFELEKLNAATDGINHLETEFGESQALFRQMVAEAIAALKTTATDIGVNTVEKARPYFDALKKIHQAGYNLHQAALSYEMSQHHHAAAKKRVNEAESKAFSNSSGKLDPSLQEFLNQATAEMMEASKMKIESWERHQQCATAFSELQKKGATIQKKLQRVVDKAKPYFELKILLNRRLEQQKERVGKIQQGISFAKKQYSQTLKNLELISDGIHKSRKLQEDPQNLKLQPREDGVGADSDEEVSIDGIRCDETNRHLSSNAGEFSISDTETNSIVSTDDENQYDIDDKHKHQALPPGKLKTISINRGKGQSSYECYRKASKPITTDGIESNEYCENQRDYVIHNNEVTNNSFQSHFMDKKLEKNQASSVGDEGKVLLSRRSNSCSILNVVRESGILHKWLSLPDKLDTFVQNDSK